MSISFNIQGIWRPLNTTKAVVRLYRYGVLYETHVVNKGDTFTLPQVATVQSTDSAHYGWTTTYGATSRNYAPTASITVNEDIDLHAVFSYTYNSYSLTYFSCSSNGCPGSNNISLTDTASGPVQLYGYLSVDYDGAYESDSYTTTLTIGSNSSCNIFSGTLDPNTAVTVYINAGQTISCSITNTIENGGYRGSQYCWRSIWGYYPKAVTGTAYRSSI